VNNRRARGEKTRRDEEEVVLSLVRVGNPRRCGWVCCLWSLLVARCVPRLCNNKDTRVPGRLVLVDFRHTYNDAL
jgi:hypothetical protein